MKTPSPHQNRNIRRSRSTGVRRRRLQHELLERRDLLAAEYSSQLAVIDFDNENDGGAAAEISNSQFSDDADPATTSTDPRVELENNTYRSPETARIVGNSSFTVLGYADDIGLGDSGITSLVVEYSEQAPGGNWSLWQNYSGFTQTTHATEQGPHYAAEIGFDGQQDHTYGFRMRATDGQGQSAFSNETYVSVTGTTESNGRSYVLLDFTPDVIADELLPAGFLELFTSPEITNEHYPFLDIVDDDVIDINDARQFLTEISRSVRDRLADVSEDYDVRVRGIKDSLEQDSDEGQLLLDLTRQRDDINGYVIYVGGALAGEPKIHGLARQGPHDGNSESYGYAFARTIADYASGRRKRQSVISHNESVTATLSGLNVQIQSGDTDFVSSGVVAGDLVLVDYVENDPEFGGQFEVQEVLLVASVDSANSLTLASTRENDGLVQDWSNNARQIQIKRQQPLKPNDYVLYVSGTIVHELGHLIGVGHPVIKNTPDDINIMNSGVQPYVSDIVNVSVKTEITEYRYGYNGELNLSPFGEFEDSFSFDTNFQQFDQFTRGAADAETIAQQWIAGKVKGATEPIEFLSRPLPEREDPPPASNGTVDGTSIADVANLLTSGLATFRNQSLSDAGSSFNLPGDTLPMMTSSLGDLLNLGHQFQLAVPPLSISAPSTMTALADDLTSLGFTIDHALTDAEFNGLPPTASSDFIRVSKAFPIGDLVESVDLSTAALDAVGGLDGFGFGGSIDVNADLMVSLTFGVDTGGFYLLPGEIISSSMLAFGTANASAGPNASAEGRVDLSLHPQLNLKTTNTDGRVRLSDLAIDFSGSTELTLQGAAIADFDFNLDVIPNSTTSISGQWKWSFDESGFSPVPTSIGFSTESMLDALGSIVESGVNLLGESADQIADSTNKIPLIGTLLGDSISTLVADNLNYNDLFTSARDSLEEQGFQILALATPQQLIDHAVSGTPLPGKLLEVRYVREAFQNVSLSVNGSTGDLVDGIATVDLSLAGQVNGQNTLGLDIIFGIDGTGVYVQEGSDITNVIVASGALTGSTQVGGLAGVAVSADAAFDGAATLTIDDGDANLIERLYLNSGQHNAVFSNTDAVSLSGSASLNAMVLTGTFTPLQNLIDPITLRAQTDWNLSAGDFNFFIEDESVLESMFQIGVGVIDDLRLNVANLAGRTVGALPLIGGKAGPVLSGLLADQLTIDTSGADTFANRLAAVGVTPISSINGLDFLTGNYNASTDLAVFSYSRSGGGTPTVATELNVGKQDVLIGDLDIKGSFQVTPELDIDLSFGYNIGQGFFLGHETDGNGSHVGLVVDAAITLDSANSGLQIRSPTGGALMRADAGGSVVLSDQQTSLQLAPPSQRIYPTSIVATDFGLSYQPGTVSAAFTLGVDFAKFPVIGDVLAAVPGLTGQRLEWSATASQNTAGVWDFSLAADPNQTGSYTAGLDSVFDAGFGQLTAATGDIEKALVDLALQNLSQKDSHPIPNELRKVLGTGIQFLGQVNATQGSPARDVLLALAGLDTVPQFPPRVLDALEILFATDEQLSDSGQRASLADDLIAADQSSGDQVGISVNYDVLQPANVLALLMGQDTDLLSLSINEPDAVSFATEYSIFPETLLSTLWGVGNLTVEGLLIPSVGLGYNVAIGLDTKGLYVEGSGDPQRPLLSVTGSIDAGLEVDLEASAAGDFDLLDVAQGTATFGLEFSGNVHLDERVYPLLTNQPADEGLLAKLSDQITVLAKVDLSGKVGLINDDFGIDLSRETTHTPFTYPLYQSGKGDFTSSLARFDDFKEKFLSESDQVRQCAAILDSNALFVGSGQFLCGVGDAVLGDLTTENIVAEAIRFRDTVREQGEAFVNDPVGFTINGIDQQFRNVQDIGKRTEAIVNGFKDGANRLKDAGVDFIENTILLVFDNGALKSGLQKLEDFTNQLTRGGQEVANSVGNAGTAVGHMIPDTGVQVVDDPGEAINSVVSGDCCSSPFGLTGGGITATSDADVWTPLDVVPARTFTTSYQNIGLGSRLVVHWDEQQTEQRFGSGEMNFTIGMVPGAGPGDPDRLFLDAPDFDQDEILAVNQDGEEFVQRVTHQNMFVAPATGVLEIWIEGTDLDDRVVMLSAGDGFQALPMSLKVFAYGGNDLIVGGPANDLLIGGAGQDTLIGGAGDDEISGSGGADVLLGGDDNDTIYGGAGADQISGEQGDDRLYGYFDKSDGTGYESPADGNDRILGGDGNDVLWGANSGPELDRIPIQIGITFPSFGPAVDVLEGGAGDDTLYGGSGPDELYGGSNDDVLDGGSEDDYLVGGNGSDQLFGGDDQDILLGDDVQQTFSGHDLLDGGNGNDRLFGGGGNDTLSGGQDADYIEGNQGDDKLGGGRLNLDASGAVISHNYYLDANDVLVGGVGHDELWGGASGSALARVDGYTGYLDVLMGGPGNDTLRGGIGPDLLDGGQDDDELFGENGDDLLTSSSGRDTMIGGSGHDELKGSINPITKLGSILRGGSGNDTLVGSFGPDELDGEDDDDIIVGGTGSDSITGGWGKDTLYSGLDSGGGGLVSDINIVFADQEVIGTVPGTVRDHDDIVYGSYGQDIIDGGVGNEEISAFEGDDTIETRDGDDTITGGSGSDMIRSGWGRDLIHSGVDEFGGGATYDIDVIDADPKTLTPFPGTELDHSDTIFGSSGADTVFAGHGDNVIKTFGGNDSVVAEAGDDWIDSGAGNDTVVSKTGDDTIIAGSGSDQIYAGWGADLIYAGIEGTGGGLLSDVNTIFADEQTFSSVPGAATDHNDTVSGSNGNDTVYAGPGDDVVSTYSGNDFVEGYTGADDIDAGDDDDVVYGHTRDGIGDDSADDTIRGGGGNDVIYAGLGNDSVMGDAGFDQLFGENGNDILDGGDDSDLILGGFGNDSIDGGSGPDRIEGGHGDDTVTGGLGDDLLLGGPGNDNLSGDEDDDSIDGGEGVDTLRGGSGGDHLTAGSGIGNQLFGDDGDDTITGSSDGAPTDPDFFDTTYFGDLIDAGADNDTVYGLGGADLIRGGGGNDRIDTGSGQDYVLAGDGDDWVFVGYDAGETVYAGQGNDTVFGSHAGDDLIFGEGGDDDLFGQGGNDSLRGGIGDDLIDGGAGTDDVEGGEGDDELHGGGGVGDQLRGDSGNDTIYGSDDGGDLIYGGVGRDTVMAGAGNDQVFGDDGDDILRGGPGDDSIYGGGGSDLVVGDGDHDLLFGHNLGNVDDDNAVDYVYGDFATNAGEPGSGRDQIDGGGGNDQLFGEADDDLIVPGGGASDLVDYGSGETAQPSDFVAPAPTADPTFEIGVERIPAAATLPGGVTYGGRWTEFSGSASGKGIANRDGDAIEPDTIIAADGSRYLAWVDTRNGNQEIYVAKHTDAGGWQALGHSASGGGVSNTTTPSRRPKLAIDTQGNVVVAWTETSITGGDIYIARFDDQSGDWTNIGSTRNVTGTGAADHPSLINSNAGLILAWIDEGQGVANGYLRRFDGTLWQELAGSASSSGVTASAGNIADVAVAVEIDKIAVVWTQTVGDHSQIYALEYSQGSWASIGGSTSADGISHSLDRASAPSPAYHGGDLFVSWLESNDGIKIAGPTVRVSRLVGASWTDVTPSLIDSDSVVTGLPQLASGGGELFFAWTASPDDGVVTPFFETPLFINHWDGNQFREVVPGDASDRGIHQGSTSPTKLSLTVDPNGNPYIAWQQTVVGQSERVYFRGDVHPLSAGHVYEADGSAGKTITELLAANDLAPGDTILITDDLVEDVVITAADSGVTLIAVPGASLTGNVSVAAADVTFQRLTIHGDLVATNADRLTIRESFLHDVTIDGGTDARIVDAHLRVVTLQSSVTSTLVTGSTIHSVEINSAVDVTIEHNRITGGAFGVGFSGPSSGQIRFNTIFGTNIGLEISAPFQGMIAENEIHGNAIGVQYDAAATLSQNRIHDNATGVQATVVDLNDAFGFVGDALPNIISNNTVGVSLSGRMRGQSIIDNVTGVMGMGILGGDDWNHHNTIESNDIGVLFDGEIRYNRIGSNRIGINAQSNQLVAHNVLYRNQTAAINIIAVNDVRVVGNTMYAPQGDNVFVGGSSTQVEIQNNVMWVETGYNINVSDDSRTGFYSDYNLLHSSGSGTLIHWVKDFGDLLDWQEDVHQFDLHSSGTTAVNPEWSEPRFLNRSRDNYGVWGLVGGQRFTSPSIAMGNPLIDSGRSVTGADQANPLSGYDAQNLLTNTSFEQGLAGWLANPSATTKSSDPTAHDGDSYFVAGQTVVGLISQVVDLTASGTDLAAIDAGLVRLMFGGRVRSANESVVDRGQISIEMLDGGGSVLASLLAKATDVTDRWELVGGDAIIVTGTRSLRYTFTSTRQSGNSSDAFLDGAFLRVAHVAYSVDAGAWTGSPAEVVVNASPNISLRFPDLYTDWERDKSRQIRWDSYNNFTDVPVRIDLFQDGVDGPAFITTIAAATPDDGVFDWTPADSGIDYGTHDLIIQVSRTDNQIVSDRSTESFSVPENTTTYYVNDGSLVADQFTTAVGDNRNTGRTADSPKPYPNNVLRIYSLGPNDTHYVDAGDYDLLFPIVLSGTVGVGDDEGFVFTGPDQVGSDAKLSLAVDASDHPLITLNDADLMTLRHLTLNDALHGILAVNGSTGIVANDLNLSGHSGDGIRIETGSILVSANQINSSDNAGHGIYSADSVSILSNITANNNSMSGVVVSGASDRIEDIEVIGNGQSGLLSNGATTLVQRVVATSNELNGIDVRSAGVLISDSQASANRRNGIYVYGNAARIEGNLVSNNLRNGIHADRYGIIVSGNTVWGHQSPGYYGIFLDSSHADGNVVFDNANGIFSAYGSATANRVYANQEVGIYARQAGDVTSNVVYSNAVGIQSEGYGYNRPNQVNVRGNLVYGNSQTALVAADGDSNAIENNTLYQLQGDGIEIVGNSVNVRLRNNIVVVDSGTAISIDKFSQTGFDSDYNLLRHGGSGLTGRWGSRDLADLAAWRIASFGDANSLSDDPLFVDVDGNDNTLGYVSAANDGRDDDFHVTSSIGRFTGSLAPVRDDVTGLPVYLPVSEFIDAVQSPAIDHGDESTPFDNEPVTNGGYVNLGAYGNTAQASKSPAEFLIVVAPNGDEAWPIGRTFDITWRSTQLSGEPSGFVDIDLIRDGDAAFVLPLVTSEMSLGKYQWLVPASVVPAEDYRIRVTRSDITAGLADQSDSAFEITLPISVYYVNDSVDPQDEYTTAVGDDANDGLTPATPKASLRAIFESGLLKPGDTVVVDHGTYAVDTNLTLGDALSGITIQGPVGSAARATLDRGNTNSGILFEFTGADDVTIAGLTLTGSYQAIYADGGIYSDQIEIIGNTFVDNGWSGVYAGRANRPTLNEWRIADNTFYGAQSGYGVHLTQVDAVVENNIAFDNGTGIYLSRRGDLAISLIASGNIAYQNGTGIEAIQGAIAEDNLVYANGTGIFAGTSQDSFTPSAYNNVAYDNDIGIRLQSRPTNGSGADAIGNTVFGNRVGIKGDTYSYEGFSGTIQDNLVYDNEDSGILIVKGIIGAKVVGNTIYEVTANVVTLQDQFTHVDFRNNIFSVVDGYVFDFADGSEEGHSSDFNLFDLGTNGKIAKFQSGEITTLEDWSFEFGQDAHSRSDDPHFVDADGVDDQFGFSNLPMAAPIVIDNGEADFSTTGQWNNKGTGYQDNSLVASDPSNVAVWTFADLTPGATYTVATTVGYVYPSNYDRQARYQIFTEGRLSSQQHKNQQYLFSPDDFDFEDGGIGWNRLGYYTVGSDGSLRVELTGSGRAGEYPVADAIRIQQIVGLVADDDDFHLQTTSPGIDGGDPSFDVSAEPSPNGGRVNLGAYGGTAEATVSDATALIHLIDPAGTQRFRARKTMPIRWQSETGSPVDLLLFDASGYTPGVSSPVHVIAQDLSAAGKFDWLIPENPMFPIDHDYLVQVVEVSGLMPSDLSEVPVTIAASGNTFYVNDGSAVGDSYTTAIGDNRNIGTRPDQPMATLQAVLNSYDLGPGDVVYVDAGYYPQLRNIYLDESVSGITIQGPIPGESPAVLDRRNLGTGKAVFDFIGGDDITIANLSITGGDRGIFASGAVDSDNIHLFQNEIYDNGSYGIQVGYYQSGQTLDNWSVIGNRIYGHQQAGVLFNDADGEIRDNIVFNNVINGISLDPGQFGAGGAVAVGNTVWGSQTGIAISYRATAQDNTVYDNTTGISVYNWSSNGVPAAINNTVYNNSLGIALSGLGRNGRDADAIGNHIFGNEVGIRTGNTSFYNGFTGSIRDNLIYANTGYAIEIGNAYSNTFVVGNTIGQSSGNAIHVKDYSFEIDFRDNIFSVDDRFVFQFENDSQVGHTSDYNLFNLGATGKIADFGWAEVATYEDWFYEVGFDANGHVGDPQFIDPDGADDVLGYAREMLGNAIIIDDGDPGFTTTGTWTAANGFQGDSLVATAPSDRAIWEFTGLVPGGTYQFSATVPYVNYSPNDARFYVHSDGFVVGAPRMNQSYVQTFDFTDAGVGWDELGIYRAGADGTLRIELLAGDGQYDRWSTADAVRLEPVMLTSGEDDDFHLQSDSEAIDAGDPTSDASAEPIPNGSRINQGAYGGTAEATMSSSPERVHLDSPNGKDRYNIGQILPIRWASEADGPVDIAIYEAAGFQAGVSTPLLLIADDLVSAGQFDWIIPSDGSIPAGFEYVIEVRSLGGMMPRTVSDQPFLIAPVGNEYFVNDGSQVGDVYTTAVGDNQNSGKAVDQPMASLAALLRVYTLDPGDTVFVDAGHYNLLSNIRLDERFSGVTIVGAGNNTAVLDRQLTGTNAYVFDFVGADDVTIQGLSMTGAQRGINAEWNSDSHRISLIGNEIFGNSSSGISIARGYANTDLSGWVIRENRIHSNGGDGGVFVSGSEVEIIGNEIFGNSVGIYASGLQVDSNSILIHNNRVYENLSRGIHAERSTVTENEVFGNATGIFLSEADAIDNDVYQNTDGIVIGNLYNGYNYRPDNQVRGNRVFANTGVGITFRLDGQLVGNYVYSNSVGILADNVLFYGEIANNLIYANTNQGIVVRSMYGGGGGELLNNTVYQRVGDALRIEGGSKDLVARNNILIVDAGNAVSIAADSQVGLDLDWNLLQKGTDPNAHLGLWGSTVIDDLALWQTTTSLDANSLTGDPGFLDIDGADNVLGFVSDNGGYDGGRDDNFYRTLRSIAIDRGDSWSAPHTDIIGAERSDDSGTPNAGTPDYVESITFGSDFVESGTGYELSSYDSRGLTLPFTFDFYGRSFNSITVSVSGFLHLDGPDYPSWGRDNHLNEFLNNARIAPAWDDFGRNPTESDFYYDDTVADQVTVSWNGINTADESDVHFSVTLFASGEIRFDYGSGNTNLTPTVGISAGDGLNYFLASVDGSSSLDSFGSLSYTLVPGFADLGAFEFQGDSNDTSPPTVIGSTPAGIHTGSVVVAETGTLVLQLSEPLNAIDANASAAYSLLSAGADGVFGNLDDRLIDLLPSYQQGSTEIRLNPPTSLSEGNYRLTLFGQQTLHDQSGLRLDGDGDGNEGGNYVREFSVAEDFPPTADDQQLTIDEDSEVTITLTGDDGNTTVVQTLRYVITTLPDDGTLALASGGAAITVNQLPLLLDSAVVYFKPTENTHATSRFQFVTRDDDGVGLAPQRTSATATVTILVTPINDPPTVTDWTVATSEFSAVGAIVSDIVYSDTDLQDVAGDSHTLAIIAGNEDAAFAINASGQIIVLDPTKLDHESAPVRALTVQVTDAGGLIDTATLTVNVLDALEAQVESVTLDDGDTQRSSVHSLTVQFNQLVNLDFSGDGPFLLTHVESGDAVGITAQLFGIDDKTVVRLLFLPGPHVGASGGLTDGHYQLSIRSSRVSVASFALDGNTDGTVGDDFVYGAEQADSFFRFFGDSDGDGDVDGQDYGRFALTFMRSAGDAGYNPSMDFDRDGDVDGQDYGQFDRNFLRRL